MSHLTQVEADRLAELRANTEKTPAEVQELKVLEDKKAA